MASNLTTFFPATGGSSDITDPRLLPRFQVGAFLLFMKTRWANSSGDEDNFFWAPFSAATMSEEFSMVVMSTSTYNTYETVLDITSSTNGGYLHHVIGTQLQANDDETYKITVDGVATEIVRDPPVGMSYGRGVIGWLATQGSASATAAAGNGGGNGSMGEQSYYSAVTSNYSVAVAQVNITNGFRFNNNAYYTVPNQPLAYPSLKFKETLKIEIKRSGSVYASANSSNAGARYSLI
jgi:hypothetical protein